MTRGRILRNINQILDPGENVIKKQAGVYDQGIANQSDGTLYLTNKRVIFHISQNNISRGLELVLEGENNAHIEFIQIPLEYVNYVDKKRMSIEINTSGSIFREIQGRKYLLGPKGTDRSFVIGSTMYRFAMNIFVNKDEWVNLINNAKNSMVKIENQNMKNHHGVRSEDFLDEPQEASVMKEKIVIREIVKIKCRYCGTLNDQSASRCQHCGARIT